MNQALTSTEKLSWKDFASDQEVRWCPGCGDYAILKAMQKTLAELAVKREDTVFISGIGCSSRFPYHLSTYGFHTIHGRAPAIATGVKIANPDLDVWVITGDGDGLSIGGNHLIHILRRNVDVQILLFNNEIYGLTKGQYSPTTRVNTLTPSSPTGSIDQPLSPCALALGAGARFIARGVDTDVKGLPMVLKAAHTHHGASFVEIFQNCIVYNDNVFADFTEKKVAADRQLQCIHGGPLVFGKERDKGLVLDTRTLALKVVQVGDDGVDLEQVLVHDQTNKGLAQLLIDMPSPDFPVAVGVIYNSPGPSFVDGLKPQEPPKPSSVADLLISGSTWKVNQRT